MTMAISPRNDRELFSISSSMASFFNSQWHSQPVEFNNQGYIINRLPFFSAPPSGAPMGSPRRIEAFVEPAAPSAKPFIEPPAPIRKKIDEIRADDLDKVPFFQEKVCTIGYEPLRDPVVDARYPQHIYERANILEWLKGHDTNPMTREPMSVGNLVPVPELRDQINTELNKIAEQLHQQSLNQHRQEVERLRKEHEDLQDRVEEQHRQRVEQMRREHEAVERSQTVFRALPTRSGLDIDIHELATFIFQQPPQFAPSSSLLGRVTSVNGNRVA